MTSLRIILLTLLVARGKQEGQRSGTNVWIQVLNNFTILGSKNSHDNSLKDISKVHSRRL